MIIWLDINLIADPKTRVCEKKVAKHLMDIEEGKEPLPIDVAAIFGGMYNIRGNGRHRFLAYQRSGFRTLPVCVVNDSQNDE